MDVALTALGLVIAADVVIAQRVAHGRWFLLHSVVNVIITVLAAHDTLSTLAFAALVDRSSFYRALPAYLCLCLHVYHAVVFRLKFIDVVHHSVMMATLVVPLLCPGNILIMAFTNATLFFTCGLPGAIDYFCMCLVANRHLSALTEKSLNYWLNTYVRAPGVLFMAFLAHQNGMTGVVPTPVGGCVALVLFWNAQYFSGIVAVAYGQAKHKHALHRL